MYVNATREIGLRFVRGSDLRLSVYVGADYAAASNDGRSVFGVAVMLGAKPYWMKEFYAEMCYDCHV